MTDRLKRHHSVSQLPATWNSRTQQWEFNTSTKYSTDSNNNFNDNNSKNVITTPTYYNTNCYCNSGRNTICTSSLRKYRNSNCNHPQHVGFDRDRENHRANNLNNNNNTNIIIDRDIFVPRDHKCNYSNCGKILWVSRSGGLRGYGSQGNVALNSGVLHNRPMSSMSLQTGDCDEYVIRTNMNGLPSTPGPEQRNAYLANRYCVSAQLPIIYGPMSYKSPRRYVEGDVNIHYKSPIRYEYKDAIPEQELARKQAESMQQMYIEERRRKYLQELEDMSNRRHTDNFIPSQKSPIPLNRYDDFPTDVSPKSPASVNLSRTVARALYNFQGQTARELSFKKGDVIYIRRQIDKNWYEGEHNAMVGLLPVNYVEIISKDGIKPAIQKKPSEGQARAKFDFAAKSGLEISLNKGELVTLTRRVDQNWFEGKIANRKGIFPVSYVEVLTDIGAEDNNNRVSAGSNGYGRTVAGKPVGGPASRALYSTSDISPTLDQLRASINHEFNHVTNGGQHPNGILRETKTSQKTEVLHIDTNSEPRAYRAIYKYLPQNNDELELFEGDIVHVLEKCDDGWYVGTSQRTGNFGTFPGNYVQEL